MTDEQIAREDGDAGVCPECGTDWYWVMEYEETMQREDVNFCPTCGEAL